MQERHPVVPSVTLTTGHVVVKLVGEVDLATSADVGTALADAARVTHTGVVVDLADLTFIDASGLRVLMGAHRDSRHLPAGLRLAAVPAHVIRLLNVTGFGRHLAVFPTVREAARLLPRYSPAVRNTGQQTSVRWSRSSAVCANPTR
jgi:anti-sigma B factor antagonist